MFAWFLGGSLAGTALVALTARVLRGRIYAIFASVILGIHSLLASALAPHVGVALPAYAAVHALVYVNFLGLVRPALRPPWYRALVSFPSAWFSASVFLGLPWAIATAFGAAPRGLALPFVLAGLGFAQTIRHRFEERHVGLDDAAVERLSRHRGSPRRTDRPLRLVQLTDPHLGPFMSEHRLRGIAERAVAAKPDLVLLTGDYLTMESHDAREVLARALGPLKQLEGRVFACLGNHDHEALDTVKGALDDIGARLLVDESTVLETEAGRVQIVGFDFHFRDRARRTAEVCERHPRALHALRLVLLHDPGAFRHLPDGEADLVLAGHTHGGQLGLVALGLPQTIVSAFTSIPDHGLWALGTNRLYVHRGTGHYGFPLRVGVPGEESVLCVHASA
jgi:predicted MPP superfamily phosphohydrolase